MPNRFLSYLNKASFTHFSCFNTSEYRFKARLKEMYKKTWLRLSPFVKPNFFSFC